jgi:S-adenosylmethionine decarboxylase
MKIDFFFFRHKDFTWPELQLWPHGNFDEEIKFLDQYFKNGNGQVLGSYKNDQWYCYIEDNRKEKKNEEVTFEVLMHQLDTKAMSLFYKKENVTVEETTKISGIESLLQGATIDAYQFEPCGYSMNSLLDDVFSTIHITPEDHCSYMSFETNISAEVLKKTNKTYSDIINEILTTFNPKRASVTFFSDLKPLQNLNIEDLKIREKAFTVLGFELSTNKSKEYKISFEDKNLELIENLEID